MKTSLYKEWLELNTLNRGLDQGGQPTVAITPVDERYSYILHTLSRETFMDFKEPDVKVLKQGYRETEYMYLISQGACDVTVYDHMKENPSGTTKRKLLDQYVRTLG